MDGDDMAFPVPGSITELGLTKREYFAAIAMQGILGSDQKAEYSVEECAGIAVMQADALIAELSK